LWNFWYESFYGKLPNKNSIIDWIGAEPSTLFTKHFTGGNVSWIGKAKKFFKPATKEVINTSFYTFLKGKGKLSLLGREIRRDGELLPGNYRMAYTNVPAAFSSAAKYDRKQPFLNKEAWALAGEWTKQHFFPFMGGSVIVEPSVVLTEADRSTSPGYPASLFFKTKGDLIDDPKASKIFEEYYSRIALPDGVPIPIWTNSLKVEIRSIDKLVKNDIRTFTASPYEHTYGLNRICWDQNQRFYASANKHWSFVGCSKYFRGWDTLYRRLDKHPNAFELDESQYDCSLFQEAMWGQRDIRFEMLSPEYQTERNYNRITNLYESMINTVIIMCNGDLIRKWTGNPSGSGNTIVDNTMILFRLFAYAYILVCWSMLLPALYLEFTSNVEAALNGDDNTFTVSDEIVSWFNPITIKEIWDDIGVITKTPDEKPRSLAECSFLSQGFAFSKTMNCWVPVPETSRVLCSMMYGSDVDDVRWHLLRANALRLDAYCNEEVRKVLSQYISYINHVHHNELFGVINDIPMKDIHAMWKSNLAIEALYSGYESSDADKHPALLKIINYSTDIKQACSTKQDIIFQDIIMTKTKGQKARKKLVKAAKKAVVKKAEKAVVAKVKGKGSYSMSKMFSNVKGKGGYFKDTLSGIGSTVGSVADVAHGIFKAITGSGSYHERAAQAQELYEQTGDGDLINTMKHFPDKSKSTVVNMAGGNPNALNMGALEFSFGSSQEDVTIAVREFIMDVTFENTSDFQTKIFRINPGILSLNDTLFPWGSKLAKMFQLYRLEGAILEFNSQCSNYNTVPGLGRVVMSTNYDPGAAPFDTMNKCLQSSFATTANPSCSFIHPVECKGLGIKYTHPDNNLTSTADNRLEDIGVFQISGDGFNWTIPDGSTTQTIGQLWMTYKLSLSRKVLREDSLVSWTAATRLYGATLPGPPGEGSGEPFSLGSPTNLGGVYPNPNNSMNVTPELVSWDHTSNAVIGKLHFDDSIGERNIMVKLHGIYAGSPSPNPPTFGTVNYITPNLTPLNMIGNVNSDGESYYAPQAESAGDSTAVVFLGSNYVVGDLFGTYHVEFTTFCKYTGSGEGIMEITFTAFHGVTDIDNVYWQWIITPIDLDINTPGDDISNGTGISENILNRIKALEKQLNASSLKNRQSRQLVSSSSSTPLCVDEEMEPIHLSRSVVDKFKKAIGA